jgi:hypothetical protein
VFACAAQGRCALNKPTNLAQRRSAVAGDVADAVLRHVHLIAAAQAKVSRRVSECAHPRRRPPSDSSVGRPTRKQTNKTHKERPAALRGGASRNGTRLFVCFRCERRARERHGPARPTMVTSERSSASSMKTFPNHRVVAAWEAGANREDPKGAQCGRAVKGSQGHFRAASKAALRRFTVPAVLRVLRAPRVLYS